MTEPHQYGFDEKLRASQGESSNGSIRTILMNGVPSAVDAYMAHEENDRSGVDWWVECLGARFLAVDCKVREEDWAARGHDDVALETWSVKEKGIIGWTLDKHKRADFILWLWKDTGRWMLVPFQMLCRVFAFRRDEWCRSYKVSEQSTNRGNGSYRSECVFVPRRELWKEIYRLYGGGN